VIPLLLQSLLAQVGGDLCQVSQAVCKGLGDQLLLLRSRQFGSVPLAETSPDGYFLNRPTKYITTDNTTLTRIDVASGK